MYLKYIVKLEDDNKKAEYILRDKLNISIRFLKKIRNNNSLRCNGKVIFTKEIVYSGDILELNYTEENEASKVVENPNNIEIVYEDEWYLIANKPANLPSHPRYPGDDGITTLFGDNNLRAANRLDNGTSGLIILAKNAYAHDSLSYINLKKIYLGLVHGKFNLNDGEIIAPIGREENTIIFRKVREDGKFARTFYKTLAFWPNKNVSLIAYLLDTGRTHQIRVHSRYMNHPIVGDQFYGWEQTYRFQTEIREGKTGYYLQEDYRDYWDETLVDDFKALSMNRNLNRQFLHAYILEFKHPITNEILYLKANLPADLNKLIDLLQQDSKLEINWNKINSL